MRLLKYILFSTISLGFACQSPEKNTEAPVSSKKVQVSYYTISDSTAQTDSIIDKIITPYRDSLHHKMNRVIGTASQALTKNKPEGALGNFVADLSLKTAQKQSDKYHLPSPDFCVLNNGGLRTALPQGNITVGKIFELMPFENELVLVKLPPKKTKMLISYIQEKGGVPVSGIRIKYQKNKLAHISINGTPWDSTKTYYVCTSDYLASGGDKMNFFIGEEQYSLNIKLRDAIIQYIEELTQKQQSIEPVLDKRISFE